MAHSRSFGDIILENPTYYFAKPREIDMHTLSHENLPYHEVTKPGDVNLTKESKKLGVLKVHKHEIFLKTFFAETETLWSQGPVTQDF